MQKIFTNIKRKNNFARWIKSILLGLGFGLLTSGVLLFLTKQRILTMELPYVIVSGVGAGIFTWLLVWLLLRRSDNALARRLDKNFQLQERVQTMIEYEGEEGAMYALQRADTEESLRAIPKKKLRVKRVWMSLIAFLLGATTLATACVIKPKADEPVVGPPPAAFELTAKQIVDLNALVLYVRKSNMQEPHRETIALSIEGMIEVLKVTDKKNEMVKIVDAVFDIILGEMDASSQIIEITEILWDSENKNVRALASSMNTYEWPKDESKLQSNFFASLANFTNSFRSASASVENAGTIDIPLLIHETAETLEQAATLLGTMLSSYEDRYNLVDDPLAAAVLKIKELNISDSVKKVYGLDKLAEEFKAIDESGRGTLDDYNSLFENATKIENLLYETRMEIFDLLYPQYVNTSVGEYAIKEIARVLDCDTPRLPKPQLIDDSTDDSLGEENGDISQLPPADIETKYGSDEWVLDYTSGNQVLYGTVFGKYEGEAMDKVQSETSIYTDEEKAAIERYFEILKQGFEKEEEDF